MEKIVGAAASAIFTSLFSKKGGSSAPPAPPTPEKPEAIPVASGSDVANAKRRSIAAQVARRGRASTILTEPTEKLGD